MSIKVLIKGWDCSENFKEPNVLHHQVLSLEKVYNKDFPKVALIIISSYYYTPTVIDN